MAQTWLASYSSPARDSWKETWFHVKVSNVNLNEAISISGFIFGRSLTHWESSRTVKNHHADENLFSFIILVQASSWIRIIATSLADSRWAVDKSRLRFTFMKVATEKRRQLTLMTNLVLQTASTPKRLRNGKTNFLINHKLSFYVSHERWVPTMFGCQQKTNLTQHQEGKVSRLR